jgi:hypothetical protein
MKNTLPDFSNKAVSVVLIGEDVSRLIVNPRFEMQAGRLFLIGKSPSGASKRDWIAGLDEALAWDRVQEYVIFESTKDYFKRLRTWAKRENNVSSSTISSSEHHGAR